MPIDVTALNQSIANLVTEATRTQGTEDSAGLVLAQFSAAISTAVAAALTADANANAATLSAAQAAIDQVTTQFVASDDKLGAAIVANPLPGTGPVAAKR